MRSMVGGVPALLDGEEESAATAGEVAADGMEAGSEEEETEASRTGRVDGMMGVELEAASADVAEADAAADEESLVSMFVCPFVCGTAAAAADAGGGEISSP
jgi:phage terminase Nu1 subunit (DNA packaging protein)